MSCALRPRKRFAQRRLVERDEHVAAEIDALAHLAGQALRHQRRRLVVHDVEDRGAVGPRLLGHLVDAAEAFGDQEAGLDALAFEQRVGADRGAVTEIADVGLPALRPAPRGGGSISASTPCRIARDGSSGVDGHFGDGDRAGVLVEIDEIRERPTRIDRNPVARHSIIRHPTRVRHARSSGRARRCTASRSSRSRDNAPL